MVGGFFRGTNIEQDQRFGDASKKLRDQMSFSSVLKKRVDLGKVNMEVIKPWISNEIINILGIEDEVLFEYIVNMLDESNTPDPKTMQVNLTGFLEGKTQGFMQSLWEVLLEAQESPTGIPESFIRNKVEELRVKKEEQEKIRANVQAAENRMKNGETRNAPAAAAAAAAAAEGGSSVRKTRSGRRSRWDAPADIPTLSDRDRDGGRGGDGDRDRDRGSDIDRDRQRERNSRYRMERGYDRHYRYRSRSRSRSRSHSRGRDRTSSRDRTRSRDRNKSRSRSRHRHRDDRGSRRYKSRSPYREQDNRGDQVHS